jgi:hypothetical protein
MGDQEKETGDLVQNQALKEPGMDTMQYGEDDIDYIAEDIG